MGSNEKRHVRDMAAILRGIRNAEEKKDGNSQICPRFTIEKWNERCRSNDLEEHIVELSE